MRSAIALLVFSGAFGCGNSIASPEGQNAQSSATELGKGFKSSNQAAQSKPIDVQAALTTLRTSDDSGALLKAALALCEADDEAAIPGLVVFLEDPSFLFRLDSKKEYAPWGDLRIKRVLESLAKTPRNRAIPALLTLGRNKDFIKDTDINLIDGLYRLLILMGACAEIPDPPKEILDMLESLAPPKSQNSDILIGVFAKMHTREACERIEARFVLGTTYGATSWFTNRIVPFRANPAIIDLYKSVLTKHIKEEKQRNLVLQSFFLGRTVVRTGPFEPPFVPSWREAAKDVLEQALGIAELAATMDGLNADTKKAIKQGRAEIEETLAFIKAGKPEQIAKLIADLDSNDFKTRDKATHALEQFGDWAEPALRKTLEANPSPEVRTRIQQILAKLGFQG